MNNAEVHGNDIACLGSSYNSNMTTSKRKEIGNDKDTKGKLFISILQLIYPRPEVSHFLIIAYNIHKTEEFQERVKCIILQSFILIKMNVNHCILFLIWKLGLK